MPRKGYTQTPEHRAKIAAALRGQKLSKARRRRIGQGVHDAALRRRASSYAR